MRDVVTDLDRAGQLIRLEGEVDPYLEMAAIQRRVYAAGGPAILFEQVRGSSFPAVSNLFGTIERTRFLFRDTLERVKSVVQLKADPTRALREPSKAVAAGFTALRSLPRKGRPRFERCRISDLPLIQSWPRDGGPFITLPQVLTEDPARPGEMNTNVGMYRCQLTGEHYEPDAEVGLHFQIQRGIGNHYARATESGRPLPVSIFVGGPPAHTVAAVMPLPEGLSELLFAGMLAGRRFRYEREGAHLVSSDADFVILGHLTPGETRPEGPFGDHLGYYSLQHEFPVMTVDAVYHRRDAIWPFTVVGRPPQEDTSFGALIHELTGPMVPTVVPGLHALHAVDAAGVHPLLFAVGSERYVPYEERRPREILTIANAVLGFGQASLAKYLWIVAKEDAPDLTLHDLPGVIRHVLERIDPTRDLHFQTRTTIDTLDYSGTGLNEGSKVVFAAAGPRRRTLGDRLPDGTVLPDFVRATGIALPGVLILEGGPFSSATDTRSEIEAIDAALQPTEQWADRFPLVVLCDDAEFCAANISNFLWVTFTRSNPSHDIHGVGSFTEHKHWGCHGPVVIDARVKPHHAPALEEDPAVARRVDELAKRTGPLAGMW